MHFSLSRRRPAKAELRRLQIPRLLANQTFSHVHPVAFSETHLLYLCEIIIYFSSSLTHSPSAMDLRRSIVAPSPPKNVLSFVPCVDLRCVCCVLGRWRPWYWRGIQCSLRQYWNVPSEDGGLFESLVCLKEVVASFWMNPPNRALNSLILNYFEISPEIFFVWFCLPL